MDLNFYKGKKVLVTGHTGFKGSWLCRILVKAGAEVTGYSLEAPTDPNLFSCAGRITVEPGKLPATDKDNAQAHGYGLKNIKRIAEKYYGGINIEPADDTFKLNIMMMLE